MAEIRKSGFSAITAHQRMGEGKRTLKTSSIILNRGIRITMPYVETGEGMGGRRKTPYIRNRPGRALQTGRRTGDGTE